MLRTWPSTVRSDTNRRAPPRILAALMALSGLGWLTFLSPPLANHLSPYIDVLGFVAEASLMLWLLVRSVNGPRWTEQARL
jgi:hypothetical protein